VRKSLISIGVVFVTTVSFFYLISCQREITPTTITQIPVETTTVTTSPTRTASVATIPLLETVDLEPYNRDAQGTVDETKLVPPFNIHGYHMSKLFYLKEKEIGRITITADTGIDYFETNVETDIQQLNTAGVLK
jgi:hypothetical protein